ncbi:integrase [Chitinimonas sp.]|uniref:integrase n=1 Tax=Chitinimonas sp. TaxID=1934313 RepID=UPI0035AEBC26
MDAAAWGQGTAIAKAEAEQLGISVPTLYRALEREVGWKSGRKPRADKGTTSQNLQVVEHVAAMKKTAVRKNGKAILPTTVATSVALMNGLNVAVGNAQINRLMRDRKLDVAKQKLANPHVHMRALHVNHVHEVDPSLCVVYYLKGKQYMIREDQFYKNKLEGLAKVKFKVWRYTWYEAASAAVLPWYVEAAGESQQNLYRFLMHAWGKRDGDPMHGVPRILVWDKGSANSAHAIKNLCAALGVETIEHAPGNARVKGGVEQANNLIETQFESRLKFEPVETVEQLNAAAQAWAIAYNANLIPHQDTRLRRPGRSAVSRLDLWLTITAEQLRTLPSSEVCADLMRGASVERKVAGDLSISYRHPQAERSQAYRLDGCAGVNVGDTVWVSPLIYEGDMAVAVSFARYDGQHIEYRVQPERDFDPYGKPLSAAVWGESFAVVSTTDVERSGQQLDRLAYGNKLAKDIAKDKDKNIAPFAHAGGMNAHSHLKQVELPAYLPKRGSEITTSAPVLESVRLDIDAGLVRLRKVMRHDFDAAMRPWLEARFASGIPEDQIDQIVRDWQSRHSVPVAAERMALRVVGGV